MSAVGESGGRESAGRGSAGAVAPRSRLRRLTVDGWFRVAFGVIAVLAAVTTVIVIQLLALTRREANELAGAILPVQSQAYRLQSGLLDQETGMRGYAITGDPRFLDPYTSGRGVEASAAARIRALLRGQQPMAADLTALERAAAGWRRSYAVPLIARTRHGPVSGADLTRLTASKRAFDHLRALAAAQNKHLAAAVSADRASLSRARGIEDATFAAILAVFMLVAALLAILLHHAVGRPLRRLRTASRLVADGDYSHEIQPAGPADLWAVAAAVEAMRSELVSALDASRAAEAVAERQAADLDAQAAELRRSNAELEQFAYVASHDLQEPLRKVASFCQLLEKRYSDKLDERGLQYIAFAVDGAKRMQVLINDLLTFSRVGRTSDVRIPVPLDEPLGAALAALSAAIEDSAAVIERPPRLPEVSGDATLLAMLWQNLVGNAIKFRAPGRAPVVQITASQQPDGRWQLCVADNGIGILPEFAEKVFVIFQRLHGRGVYPGTGIGLALCKRIVEQHGGEMYLDTGYTDGARICFTLLAAPSEPRGAASRDDDIGQEPAAAPQDTASTEGIPA